MTEGSLTVENILRFPDLLTTKATTKPHQQLKMY